MRRIGTIALLGCIITSSGFGAAADRISYYTKNQNTVANRLNREELSAIQRGFSTDVGPAKSGRSDTPGTGVGLLYLRGDGGDPQQVQADDSMLIYITGEAGAGRTYQHGREVDINPAVKESARQIAMQQFRVLAGAQLPGNQLPAMAQEALIRFTAGGPVPTIMFARTATRVDTGRTSEMMMAKLFSLKASLKAASVSNMIDVVKTAMLAFGFASDICDKSSDPRCDQPGVREAFAQIKREEAVQRTLSVR